ncbi:MAG TPA: signal peptidase I, partial [Nocardioidaceae bacterium]|nr:signal peptidase I [Nocardioidaceae bacterium]
MTWMVRTVKRMALTVLIAPIILCLGILLVLPAATHGAALTVLTGSMTPQISVGSVVLVRPVDTRTLQVGDIATYQAEPGKEEFITHRIVDIDTSTEPTSFTFKGDANKGPDIDPVPAGAIRGEV